MVGLLYSQDGALQLFTQSLYSCSENVWFFPYIYIHIYHIYEGIYMYIHTHICSVLFSVMLRIEPVSFHILSSIPNPISCT